MKRSSAYIAWSLATLFFAYQYILRVAPSVFIHDIMEQFHIDASVYGQFSGSYYLGYALIHIPLGLMLDRFGPKRVMPLFLLITVVGMAPLALSSFWLYPVIGRFLVGLGSSAAILGLFKIVRMGFEKEKFTWMLSIAVTVGLLGAIYGGGPLHQLHDWIGLQNVVFILMAVGSVLAVLLYFATPTLLHSAGEASVLTEIKLVISNPYTIVVCLCAGLMVGPLEGFADVWGASFLMSHYGLSKSTAVSLPSMIFVGMCLGGPLLSIIAKRVHDLKVLLACAFLMALAFVALIAGVLNAALLPVLLFAIGLLSAYQIIAIAHVSSRVPPEFTGLTSAVANMIIMVFGYFFHSAIGAVVHSWGNNAMNYAIGIIPAALGVAFVGLTVTAIVYRKR